MAVDKERIDQIRRAVLELGPMAKPEIHREVERYGIKNQLQIGMTNRCKECPIAQLIAKKVNLLDHEAIKVFTYAVFYFDLSDPNVKIEHSTTSTIVCKIPRNVRELIHAYDMMVSPTQTPKHSSDLD